MVFSTWLALNLALNYGWHEAMQSERLLSSEDEMLRVSQLLTDLAGKEFRMLRGKAMECISLIGVAVGKEKFAADAKEVLACKPPNVTLELG